VTDIISNWIGGQPVSDPGAVTEVRNPATLEVIALVEDCGPARVDEAVAAARRAFPAWSASDDERRAALRRIVPVLDEHKDGLAVLLSREQGKPVEQAHRELAGSARMLAWYTELEIGDEVLRETPQRVIARRRPVGVAGLITPWNFPVTILGMKLWATLRAGNTAIVKPAPYTPLTTLRIAELLSGVLPPGVLNTVTGGTAAGAALTAHPGIDLISFTGSTPTGRAVMAGAAPTLKRLTLELGGNDPAILLPDANLDIAIPNLVRSSFHNAGQICAAIKRIFAPAHLADEVTERMVALADSYLVLGPGDDPESTIGPVNNAAQRDIVRELVADAVAHGGKVHELGRVNDRGLPGYFLRPVIVSGLPATARLVAEEQFGPAVPVVAYDDVNQLIEGLNAEPFGLDASVWSADTAQATELAGRIRAGQVYVNSHGGAPDPEIPFGGVKGSGFGRELGVRGLDDASELVVLTLPAREAGR
jgi:acyl-CoA reductase-like NAD-dependent aldehyde dehydrogenase